MKKMKIFQVRLATRAAWESAGTWVVSSLHLLQ
jgi:hypothetical protein